LDKQQLCPQGVIKRIRFGQGKFVAVGDPGIYLISTDGANWTTATLGGAGFLADVTYGTAFLSQ